MEEVAGSSGRQTYKLGAGHELRLDVRQGKSVAVTLVAGQAEVFGTELAVMQPVRICGQKFAVFTWDGCTLEVAADGCSMSDATELVYEADETPMTFYFNAHQTLEKSRQYAKQSGGCGPRTIVVGPTDAGKSTLCKILLNYAVRMGWTPTLVDLDIGQGSITVPGSIGATALEVPVDIDEGLPVEVPLVYYFGHLTPTGNPELYKFLLDRLANVLDRRASSSAEVEAGGMILNTMGWVEGLGYELLLHAIEAFKAATILVIGDDRLESQLTAHFKQPSARSGVQVVKMPKSGGVVMRTPLVRKEARVARVKEYFYGARNDLSPHSQTVPITSFLIYRVGGGPRAPSSALPIGASSSTNPLRLTQVAISNEVQHSLLAVSFATSPEELLSLNVAGFIYVKEVDTSKGTLSYLAPCPGPLPGKYVLMGSFKTYLE